MWVEIVSLGNVARSTSRTRYPFRASSIAVGEPAQREPTTITSLVLLESFLAAMSSIIEATPEKRLVGQMCMTEGALAQSSARWLTGTSGRAPPTGSIYVAPCGGIH